MNGISVERVVEAVLNPLNHQDTKAPDRTVSDFNLNVLSLVVKVFSFVFVPLW